jgi:glycosyltransferase involved in cell wall biosynthesis
MQNKLLEAMSMQLPCVTTSLVNNGIGAIPDKHLLLAEDATTFAKQIIILYEHQSLREKMAEEGRQFIETRYDWSQSNEILRQKIEEILAQ